MVKGFRGFFFSFKNSIYYYVIIEYEWTLLNYLVFHKISSGIKCIRVMVVLLNAFILCVLV
jgi:hypothetical protein